MLAVRVLVRSVFVPPHLTSIQSVNSSDLVEDTADESWDSQNDDDDFSDEEGREDEEEEDEEDDEGGGGGGGGDKAAEERTEDKCGGIGKPSDRGGAGAHRTGREAATPQKGGRSRRNNG